MIQMDAFIILSEDENNRSYGVNLLQGLYGFFGKLSTVTEDTAAAGRQSTVVYTSGIGTSSSAASLSYSLNIANALTNRNEVIARPTLTAIDGLPSTFFSGSTLSVSVGGTVGSISNLVEKPVGLSVSITPTIIDDDTVMIAVRLVRSFIQIPTAGTSNVLVQTSRNSSSASIIARYGETVVLGGLSERETYSTDSGVPVLKNIPIVQYLFNT
jgi:type II secretory pathway component GspD/PulD (secretin)